MTTPAVQVAPAVGAVVSLMSLPAILGTTLATVPKPPSPPRPPAPPRPPRPPAPVPKPSVPKIGLCWQGSPTHLRDRHRSIPVDMLRPLLERSDVIWQSLQLGAPSRDNTLPMPPVQDFLDTAELAQGLDLVITVDTAIAHLAGSLGVPTAILLDSVPDWRWRRGLTEAA